MKKSNPMTELAMARPKECINTAYVPKTNASTVAPKADMEMQKASEANRKEKSPRFCSWNNSGMNRWIKAAEQDSKHSMAMVFVIINALKAVFLIRTGEPECGVFLTYETPRHGNTSCKSHGCNECVHYQMGLGCFFHARNKSVFTGFPFSIPEFVLSIQAFTIFSLVGCNLLRVFEIPHDEICTQLHF